MQHILDAILAGDTTGDEFAALDLPESYRAVTVHKDEARDVRGHSPPATRTPASPSTWRTSRSPSSAPARRWSP